MAYLTSQIEPPHYLMPTKFLLITGQVLLLTLVLYLQGDHLHWGVGPSYIATGSSQYQSAQNSLVGACVCFIVFLGFEFLMMLLGVSLHYN